MTLCGRQVVSLRRGSSTKMYAFTITLRTTM
ncbi:hypothetical protein NPIL_314841, partial [Nephila pilipes]